MEHEQVRVFRGRRTGIAITVAVHSTVSGPATGGCRIKQYATWRDGFDDALRLSEAMTLKCALGGVPYGGGKTVVSLAGPLEPTTRVRLIDDIGDAVASLGGSYITGPDIGSTPDDMAVIHAATQGAAFCRPESAGGSGSSSTATARGVLAALRAAVNHTTCQLSVDGLRVGVIGHGHVGSLIAQDLADQGATVTVYDLDPRQRQHVEAKGLTWWENPDLADNIDVLVPAATGGLLTPQTAAACSARLIVGPANNQLSDTAVDQTLADRGITWIPDALASGGGVIYAASREGLGLDHAHANARVDDISTTTTELLAIVTEGRTTPLKAAELIAQQRIRSAA